ncbi:MAG: dicarboxylate/amino acid:cation symporter [Candidatus Sumerlaeia bacterium]|nr:dicarboxylate/amino acid:cation symporter [Candidatus Sumerlaeia bacterium]
MSSKHSNGLLMGIVVALLLGIGLVWVCSTILQSNPEFESTYRSIIAVGSFFGKFFITALRMIIVPLILASVITGISSLGDVRKIGSIGTKTICYFLSTTFMAVGLGLLLVVMFQPGKILSSALNVAEGEIVVMEGETIEEAEARVKMERFREMYGKQAKEQEMDSIREKEQVTVSDLLMSFVSPNIIKSFAEMDMLPIILFSLILGGILTTLPREQGEPVIAFFRGLNEAMMAFINMVMYLAPVGIFGILVDKFGTASLTPGGIRQMVEGVGSYSGVLLLGLAIHGCITLPTILWLLTKRNPFSFTYQMSPALLLAWSCSSSNATLPVTIKSAVERAGIDEKAAGFVLPLGATVNMDGTALYEAVAVIFIAQTYGVNLDGIQLFLVFITATLASIGAAGVPQAGLVMMVIVLNSVGLPLEGIEMILLIDWFLDRFRTVVNVWGDCIGAAFVSNSLHWKQTA